MSEEVRFDFIVSKLNPGVDPVAIEGPLAAELGSKPEKIRAVLKHVAEKGPAAIEKGVTKERLAQLKQIWEAAGVATTSKQSLELIDVIVAQRPTVPMTKCPACGHEQEKLSDLDQCGKCGVFAKKFLEKQKKDELYQKEKERLEKIHGFRAAREEKEAREAAEAAELEAIRRQIEAEMGLNKKKGGMGWLTGKGAGPTAARSGLGGLVIAVLLLGGYYGRDLLGGKGVTPEELAKTQAVQSKQNAAQMQDMVGNLIKGSKKAAIASGAAAQFQQALFQQGDKDAELNEGIQSVQSGNPTSDAVNPIDRAEGLASASKAFVESGGSAEDAERALSASMQSAKLIKEGPQRAEAVSSVATAQLEVHSQDAREKAASGDWKSADKSFAKALTAAGEVTSPNDLVAARGINAKVRADTGDYGGSTLLFLDAMKAAEALPDPRQRAIAIADVARQMAQSTNEIEGAADRAFEKALAVAATAKNDAQLASEIVLRRVQATCDVAAFLIATDPAGAGIKPLLDRAGKDVDLVTDAFLFSKALGTYARTRAELEGESEAVKALLARADKLPEVSADPRVKEPLAAAAGRIRVEALAAAAKRIASKGEKAKAKQAFLVALKASGTITTQSQDPAVRGDVAKQRTAALSELARYMRVAGDKQAAAKVFQLAMAAAGPADAPKVLSWMVRASRGS